ncbi:hypothetical protein RQP46_010433 [Phenoliferia psychrophenolica]
MGDTVGGVPTLPAELISLIIHHLFLILLPPPLDYPSPDPFLTLLPSHPTPLPPTPAWAARSSSGSSLMAPPASRPTPLTFAPPPLTVARNVLLPLCLVSKTFNEEATKCLWRSVGFGMPKGFEGLLRTVAEYEGTRDVTPDAQLSLARLKLGRPLPMSTLDNLPVLSVADGKWSAMSGSGRRDGSMIDDGSPDSTSTSPNGLPTLHLVTSHSPLLYTYNISFSRFRTAGLRRSVSQGSMERFVTPERLLTLLRGTRWGVDRLVRPSELEEKTAARAADEDLIPRGRLEAVGFTEFMDSAITKPVLEELLLRGGYLATYSLPPPLPPTIHIHPSLSRPPSPPLDRAPARGRERVLSAFRAARDLQSSRSPTRVFVEEPVMEEEDEDDASDRMDQSSSSSESEEEEESAIEDNNAIVTPFPPRARLHRRTSGVTFADQPTPTAPRQRRSSGAAFAERSGRGPTRRASSPSSADEEGDERGRGRRTTTFLTGRGGATFAAASRSSSVPASVFLRQTTPLGLPVGARSSSVPATTGREEVVPVERELTTLLEGSTSVRPIRALDLCGCVSSKFVGAVEEMIEEYQLGSARVPVPAPETTDAMDVDNNSNAIPDHDEDQERRLVRVQFPHLRRLGLAASLLPSAQLTALVTSFPFLTHLDLTSTLTSPLLLYHLAVFGQSGPGGRAMRLTALSLARCRLMTGAALVGLFCGDTPPFTSIPSSSPAATDDGTLQTPTHGSWGHGDVVSSLTDLSLYGDSTYPSPLTQPELRLILSSSPAFRLSSTHLRSLDLSSSPLTDAFLAASFPTLPHLLELGLANCRMITFKGVALLLENHAPGVEVLDLYVDIAVSSVPNAPDSKHSRPRTLVHLPRDHSTRLALQKLVDSHGVVAGETGWHPRKMEILVGEGLMGREDGLYGFHAYQI